MHRRQCHYGWVIAGVIFVTIMIAGGIRSTPSLIITSLEAEFGWSRALISGAVSINVLLYGTTGPFAAALMDTVGMRWCIIVALLLMFGGTAAVTTMTSPWHLYVLWGVLVGLACGVIAPVLGKVVVNRWFVAHAGLMMGVFSASAQTGQVVLAPLLGYLVEVRGRDCSVAYCSGRSATPLPAQFDPLPLLPCRRWVGEGRRGQWQQWQVQLSSLSWLS
jgi:MFS family permease